MLTLGVESLTLLNGLSEGSVWTSVGAETPGSWLRAKLCMLTRRADAETRAAEPGPAHPESRCPGPLSPLGGPSEEAAGPYGRHLPSLRGKWVEADTPTPHPSGCERRKHTRGVRAGPAGDWLPRRRKAWGWLALAGPCGCSSVSGHLPQFVRQRGLRVGGRARGPRRFDV